MPDPVRVLVADDHPLYLEAVGDAIRGRPDLELVAAVKDGRVALDTIRRLEPDVAVLDVRMPGLDGVSVLAAVVRDELPTRILFCATATESSLVYDCVAAGAAGYLDKGAGAQEICDAVFAVARGETVISKRLEAGVLGQIRVRRGEEQAALSKRELEVLRLLAAGLTAPQIAAKLFVEPSTVKTHLRNLYRKLGVAERAAAVAEGMRRGLLE